MSSIFLQRKTLVGTSNELNLKSNSIFVYFTKWIILNTKLLLNRRKKKGTRVILNYFYVIRIVRRLNKDHRTMKRIHTIYTAILTLTQNTMNFIFAWFGFFLSFFFFSFHQTFYSILFKWTHTNIFPCHLRALFRSHFHWHWHCFGCVRLKATMLQWLRHHLTYFTKYCFSFACLRLHFSPDFDFIPLHFLYHLRLAPVFVFVLSAFGIFVFRINKISFNVYECVCVFVRE